MLGAININWTAVFDKFYYMFMGGENYTGLDGLNHTTLGIVGDPVLLGVFVFFVFFLLTLIFGLGMLVGTVVLIPAAFAVLQWIPDLKIIIAILSGLIFGLALQRLIRR